MVKAKHDESGGCLLNLRRLKWVCVLASAFFEEEKESRTDDDPEMPYRLPYSEQISVRVLVRAA